MKTWRSRKMKMAAATSPRKGMKKRQKKSVAPRSPPVRPVAVDEEAGLVARVTLMLGYDTTSAEARESEKAVVCDDVDDVTAALLPITA
jgi:hypothetical protein